MQNIKRKSRMIEIYSLLLIDMLALIIAYLRRGYGYRHRNDDQCAYGQARKPFER